MGRKHEARRRNYKKGKRGFEEGIWQENGKVIIRDRKVQVGGWRRRISKIKLCITLYIKTVLCRVC